MACTTTTIDSIYAVRWDAPHERDVRKIVTDVTDLHKRLGRSCIYLAIVPQDGETPSNEVRSSMIESMDKMLEHCETIHFVIEGSGFKHTVLRSAMAGILLVAGRRGRVFVHTSVDEAIRAFAGSTKVDSATLLRSLRTHKLLT